MVNYLHCRECYGPDAFPSSPDGTFEHGSRHVCPECGAVLEVTDGDERGPVTMVARAPYADRLRGMTEYHGPVADMTDSDLRRCAVYYWDLPHSASYHAVVQEADRRGVTLRVL